MKSFTVIAKKKIPMRIKICCIQQRYQMRISDAYVFK